MDQSYAMQPWEGGGWQVRRDSASTPSLVACCVVAHAAPRAQEPPPSGDHSNLYVSNLAPDVDDATLAEAFVTCGPIVSACVWRNQNTQQRCARAGRGAAARR